MSRTSLIACVVAGLLSGCQGGPSVRPVELLDERTGQSVVALQMPLELQQGEILIVGRRPSIAYIGPVEWNRMGTIRTGLWVHVVQGNDRPLADIHATGALTLLIDDAAVELAPIEAPALGREPYQPAAPWGQSLYVGLDDTQLRRLAGAAHIGLRCRAADGSKVEFRSPRDTRATLQDYLQLRGIAIRD